MMIISINLLLFGVYLQHSKDFLAPDMIHISVRRKHKHDLNMGTDIYIIAFWCREAWKRLLWTSSMRSAEASLGTFQLSKWSLQSKCHVEILSDDPGDRGQAWKTRCNFSDDFVNSRSYDGRSGWTIKRTIRQQFLTLSLARVIK